MIRPPLVLVPDTISHDTVECLQELLKHAKRGGIIGVGFVCMLKPTRDLSGYIANTAGEAHLSPTFTLGMLRALDYKLSVRLAGGNP